MEKAGWLKAVTELFNTYAIETLRYGEDHDFAPFPKKFSYGFLDNFSKLDNFEFFKNKANSNFERDWCIYIHSLIIAAVSDGFSKNRSKLDVLIDKTNAIISLNGDRYNFNNGVFKLEHNQLNYSDLEKKELSLLAFELNNHEWDNSEIDDAGVFNEEPENTFDLILYRLSKLSPVEINKANVRECSEDVFREIVLRHLDRYSLIKNDEGFNVIVEMLESFSDKDSDMLTIEIDLKKNSTEKKYPVKICLKHQEHLVLVSQKRYLVLKYFCENHLSNISLIDLASYLGNDVTVSAALDLIKKLNKQFVETFPESSLKLIDSRGQGFGYFLNARPIVKK